MKQNKFASVAILSTLLLGACGEKADPVQENINLQGRYQSEASTELSVRAGGIGCVVHKIDVSLNDITFTQISYADSECKEQVLGEITTRGTYTIANELNFAPGARELNMQISSISVMLQDKQWSSIFGIDVSGDCNIQSLQVGQSKDITGLDCGVFGKMPAIDQVYFTSYLLQGDVLSFGTAPNENIYNVGTLQNPSPRNQDLKIKFLRK